MEFSTEGGGSTHSTKIINFDQKINTSQNDPNALKHEITQYKYFPNCDPYPTSDLAEYLGGGLTNSEKLNKHVRIEIVNYLLSIMSIKIYWRVLSLPLGFDRLLSYSFIYLASKLIVLCNILFISFQLFLSINIKEGGLPLFDGMSQQLLMK